MWCFESVKGILRGCDQHTNVVLEKCHERMYTEEGVSQQPIGVYIIKGDNMYVVKDVAMPGERGVSGSMCTHTLSLILSIVR